MPSKKDRIGLWMIGVGGGVAGTVALGATALRRRLRPMTGLVTALPPFHDLNLADPGEFVIGGHEIRPESPLQAVQALHQQANLFDEKLIRSCTPQLRAVQRNIRPGTLYGVSRVVRDMADQDWIREKERAPESVVERLTDDMVDFRRRHKLDHVIVIHVASSEPAIRKTAAHETYARLQRAMAGRSSRVLPASSIYALAAVEAGCAFVNFTPAVGIDLPAVRQRADKLGLPYMGSDGKTGETLVKSALAPMFAMRNLSVLSWVGQNILGNRDGQVLSDPRIRQAKIESKDGIVSKIVKGKPCTPLSIDYVPSLDDWKIAWDFIHFEGFLGTQMNMQFTWQGSDSVLAAPLVIDLARLAALECRAGRGGPMTHLAFFFKNPIGNGPHDLFSQWQRLISHTCGGYSRAPSFPCCYGRYSRAPMSYCAPLTPSPSTGLASPAWSSNTGTLAPLSIRSVLFALGLR